MKILPEEKLQNELKLLEAYSKRTGETDICSHLSEFTLQDGSKVELLLQLDGLYIGNPEKKKKAILFTAEDIHVGNIDFNFLFQIDSIEFGN